MQHILVWVNRGRFYYEGKCSCGNWHSGFRTTERAVMNEFDQHVKDEIKNAT